MSPATIRFLGGSGGARVGHGFDPGAADGSRDSKLVDVFTERDILLRIVDRGKKPATFPGDLANRTDRMKGRVSSDRMASEARWLVPSIGPLAAAERSQTVQVLARAFRDNPLNLAVVGARNPRRRLRSNAWGTRTLLPVAENHGEVWTASEGGRVVGALIGTPPHAYPLPPPPLAARLRCLLGQGWRVARRWAEVFQALDLLHPVEPHWYLGTLGVDPDHQGRGVGTALLRHWLARVAASGSGAYLETDLRENVGFYEREGFAVQRETRILGVRVWCMRRPPGG